MSAEVLTTSSDDDARSRPPRLPRRRAPLGRLLVAETRWTFRRPRTLVLLGLMTLFPVVMGVAVELAMADSSSTGGGPAGGIDLFSSMLSNAFVLPIGALMALMLLMLPLTVVMAAGDALAGEQSHGTLRGWLLAPVSRGRILVVKAFGVLAVAVTSAGLVILSGFLTGLALNGTDGLVSMSGTSLSVPDVLGRLGIALIWATVYLMAIGAVALAISASTEHPMLVVVSVLGGLIVSGVLLETASLAWLHPFLLQLSVSVLSDLVRDPIVVGGFGEAVFRAGCYLVVGLSLAYARLATKDG